MRFSAGTMLSAAEPSLAGLSVSAREVVLALKKRGEARASEIAEALGITPSGVRQHLSVLRADGLVAYRTIHAGPGRPKFAYFLTEPAEALFPKTYHELVRELVVGLREQGLGRLGQEVRELGAPRADVNLAVIDEPVGPGRPKFCL